MVEPADVERVRPAMNEVTLLGAGVLFGAMFFGGISGFGYSLVSVPLLLMLSVSAPVAVATNLIAGVFTRLRILWIFRDCLDGRRILRLTAGSLPGIALGAAAGLVIGATGMKLMAGTTVLTAAVLLMWSSRRVPSGAIAEVVVGFLGGFLSPTTSLGGTPPALLLSRNLADVGGYLADLSGYLAISSGLAFGLLLATHQVSQPNSQVAWWVLASLVGNELGIRAVSQLQSMLINRLVLAVSLVGGGAVTVMALIALERA